METRERILASTGLMKTLSMRERDTNQNEEQREGGQVVQALATGALAELREMNSGGVPWKGDRTSRNSSYLHHSY